MQALINANEFNQFFLSITNKITKDIVTSNNDPLTHNYNK